MRTNRRMTFGLLLIMALFTLAACGGNESSRAPEPDRPNDVRSGNEDMRMKAEEAVRISEQERDVERAHAVVHDDSTIIVGVVLNTDMQEEERRQFERRLEDRILRDIGANASRQGAGNLRNEGDAADRGDTGGAGSAGGMGGAGGPGGVNNSRATDDLRGTREMNDPRGANEPMGTADVQRVVVTTEEDHTGRIRDIERDVKSGKDDVSKDTKDVFDRIQDMRR